MGTSLTTTAPLCPRTITLATTTCLCTTPRCCTPLPSTISWTAPPILPGVGDVPRHAAVHLRGVCRGPGVGRGPHDRPAVGSGVRGLPPAKLVHGPALSPDGGAPLPPNARHGHAALLAPAGGL